MATTEAELKTLMVAGLTGDAAAHRMLLDRLSGHLRAYFKGRLARIRRSATEAEDLVQEALLAILPGVTPTTPMNRSRRGCMRSRATSSSTICAEHVHR